MPLKPHQAARPVYSDYVLNVLLLGTGAAAPKLREYLPDFLLPTFSASGPKQTATFTLHILHDIKPGSIPTFHVHWSHIAAAPSGSVKWTIEICGARGYGIEGFSAPVLMSVVQPAPPQRWHATSDDTAMLLPAALVTKLEPDMILLGRISRDTSDPADTFAADAYFLLADMHYELAHISTTERNRPFTSGGFSP